MTPLRRRMIDDMELRRLLEKYEYERDLADARFRSLLLKSEHYGRIIGQIAEVVEGLLNRVAFLEAKNRERAN